MTDELVERHRIYERIKKASLKELIAWWNEEEPPEWGRITSLFFDRVAFALGRKSRKGVAFLKEQVKSSNTQRKHIVLSSLARKEIVDDEIIGYFVEAFRGGHFAWQELALVCLNNVEQFPLSKVEVEPFLNHESTGLAAQAMVYLSRAYPSETVSILKNALLSDNVDMLGHACCEVGFRNVRELKNDIIPLLKHEQSYVANNARIAMDMFEIVYKDKE